MALLARCTRWLWVAVGTLSTLLGILGAILPLVPATPFLLFAAYAYAKSSPRLHAWLLNMPWLGAYIQNWREGRGIPRNIKILAVLFIASSAGFSMIFFTTYLWVKVTHALIATGVSLYLITRPTS